MNPVVLAEGETVVSFLDSTMMTAITNAFTGIATDVKGVVGIGLPIALGITGLFLAVRLGIGFFKSVAN